MNKLAANKIVHFITLLIALIAFSTLASAEDVPMWKDKVASGALPPLSERLPEKPMIVDLGAEDKVTGKYGGDLRLLMGKAKDIGQMTVYSYARVVGYAPDYTIQPDIAESYEVNEGREFTFKLREGHKWSDGYPLTSEDFRYFWEDMVSNEILGRKGVPTDMLVQGEGPSFEVIDELTFKYTWKKPNPAFLPALAGPSPLYIYRPAHYMKQFHEKYADKDKLDALVEEAKVKDWGGLHTRKQRQRRPENPDLPSLQAWRNITPPPSTRFIFERNPFYHRVDNDGRQLPYIDRVIMNIVSKDVIPAKAGSGETDLQARYLRFDNVPFLKLGEDVGNYSTYLWTFGKGAQIALFPNLNVNDPEWNKLMQNTLFRRALSMGIDRDEINEVIYFGLASPSSNTVIPQSELYMEDIAQMWAMYDPDQSNKILDELGLDKRDTDGVRLLSDGRRAEIIVESAGESTEETDVLELIKEQYQTLGLKLFTRASQRDIFRNRAYQGETLISISSGLNNGLANPEMSPEELAPTAQPQLQWPKWGQHNETNSKAGEAPNLPKVQEQLALYNQWMVSPSMHEKKEVWQKMLKNYSDEVFSIGIVNNSRQPVVVSNDLRNVPEDGIYSWEPTSFFGIYRPDTFWFDR